MKNDDIDAEDDQMLTPYQIGDPVIYTNEQGVCWGKKAIVGTEPEYSAVNAEKGEIRYFIEPSDSPWCSVHASCLSPVRG